MTFSVFYDIFSVLVVFRCFSGFVSFKWLRALIKSIILVKSATFAHFEGLIPGFGVLGG